MTDLMYMHPPHGVYTSDMSCTNSVGWCVYMASLMYMHPPTEFVHRICHVQTPWGGACTCHVQTPWGGANMLGLALGDGHIENTTVEFTSVRSYGACTWRIKPTHGVSTYKSPRTRSSPTHRVCTYDLPCTDFRVIWILSYKLVYVYSKLDPYQSLNSWLKSKGAIFMIWLISNDFRKYTRITLVSYQSCNNKYVFFNKK